MKKGFTLAEIMVVLFIMTIILAAFAPLMTVRAKSTSKTSPWNWATPDSANTYFGVHPNQRVMIGQKTKGDDISNKLTINTTDGQKHILFKNNGTATGTLSSEINKLAIKGSSSWNNFNLIIGVNANEFTSGISNIAIGEHPLTSTTSNYNTVVGTQAFYKTTTGGENTALGYRTMYNNTTGSGNTVIGLNAGYYNTTGNYNTYLGHNAGVNNANGSLNTAIGMHACNNMGSNMNNTTCLGAFSGTGSINTTANTLYLGNQYSTVYVLGYLNATNSNISSDIRLKNIQGDYTTGLEQIKKIKPVKFTFKEDKKKTSRVGVIAQDLQKIFPKAVMKGDDGFLKIRQEDMFYAMINAIKELASKLDTIIEKQKSIEKRLQKLENNK